MSTLHMAAVGGRHFARANPAMRTQKSIKNRTLQVIITNDIPEESKKYKLFHEHGFIRDDQKLIYHELDRKS